MIALDMNFLVPVFNQADWCSLIFCGSRRVVLPTHPAEHERTNEWVSSLSWRFAEITERMVKHAYNAATEEVHAIAFLRRRTSGSHLLSFEEKLHV